MFTNDDFKNSKLNRNPSYFKKTTIEDNVLIGSNCTIDRGTIDDTQIGDGTKFDNQVHIGHNVNIGKKCIICAQVGIGGSTKIYDKQLIA